MIVGGLLFLTGYADILRNIKIVGLATIVFGLLLYYSDSYINANTKSIERLSIKNALRGCKHLFHVAADYRLWARRSRDLYDNNVLGTNNIMLGALEGGIERVVYTSSVATIGVTKDGVVSDESTKSRLSDRIGHYKRSKFLAEKEVDRLIRSEIFPAVIVNPSTPIGPRDIKPTPTGRIILDAINGRMPAYVNTGLNIAHVDDIATGHLLAFQRGAVGERYILGGEDLTLKEILFHANSLL